MSSSAEELELLERVFLRLGSTETDTQLETVLGKFLTPVLLKLSSPHEQVRKKVMELLIHVNKRLKTRPKVQLPVEALLTQYNAPQASSFMINFCIIYIKIGFPRLSQVEQIELVPTILNALKDKPQAHIDSLLCMLLPLLGLVKVPTDPKQIPSAFGFDEKPELSKHLLGFLLDVLLLPYSAVGQKPEPQSENNTISVPPAMSDYSFKRVLHENETNPDSLEQEKLGIVKFLSHGIFKNDDVILHFIVASSDTRFEVANLAETEVRKIIGTVDWSSQLVCKPIYVMYLGSQGNVKDDQKKSPASIRIRLKLLHYLCRAKDDGLVFPLCIQVVFDSLYGTNTNTKLKGLALNFTNNIIRSGKKETLQKLASVLLGGLQKYTTEGEESQKGQAYVLIGLLAQKFPDMVYHNLTLFEHFLHNLEEASADLKLQIREGFLSFITAFKYDTNPDEADKDGRLNLIFALIKSRSTSEDVLVRFVTVKVLASVFPPKHVPSKLLLLQACGDMKDEVSSEAYKSLYGKSRKAEINLSDMDNQVVLPSFTAIMKYIENEDKSQKRDIAGNKLLPYSAEVCKEVLIYVRLCLIQDANVPLVRDIMNHPCDETPLIAEHLRKLYSVPTNGESESFYDYLKLCRQLLISNTAIEALSCLVEAIGCLPQYSTVLAEDITWIRDQLLSSTRIEVREYGAVLYGLLLMNIDNTKFEEIIRYMVKQCSHRTLEVQHGALLALGNCLESRLRSKKENLDVLLSDAICVLNNYLTNSNVLLSGAACTSIGVIACCTSLPIADGKIKESPDAKKPATETITKADLLTNLLNILNNKKFNTKLKEKAAMSVGLLCVGERFPHTRHVLEGLLDTAKETKDVEVHLTIGESLVMCIQSVYSPEARNKWFKRKTEFNPEEQDKLPDQNLDWLLGQLLKISENTNPNSRQASSIWLLAIVKSCGKREPISVRLDTLQNTFLRLLGENNDIVQDVASKALCVFYDTYKSEELLSALVRQLTAGARQVQQVSSDTKLFENGQLGASPTGGNLTTYKELCSLASDLNKPDLIYQFMHLANHNAMWNSKKGAAFGFSTIAKKCGEELKNYLPDIVPKLYRYQYDPSPNIQNSMHNIWRVLVSEQQKVVEQYFHEILKDLIDNLNSGQYRVRQSCCLAIQDLLKSSGNKSVHDAVNNMEELWSKLFRVMDDHHEETRKVAINTARVLSKLCVQSCGETQGKDGIKMLEAILPPLLNDGIMSSVAEIRLVSLQAISQLVDSCGQQVKPFLPTIVPALLKATGDLESNKLSYLSTRLGGTQTQEIVDDARASMAKSYFTTETVSKSLQYVDNSILEQLIPKIIELMKQSVGLATRIACTHCLTLLIVQMAEDMQPYCKKLVSVLSRGLKDRNAAIRKHYAVTLGYVVSAAKESTVEKLINDLDQWYIEGKDSSVKSAIAFTIQSISVQSSSTMKKFSSVLLPLIFFAMHDEKIPENMSTLQIWDELWSENTSGTETGIKQHLHNHINTIKSALETQYWTAKAQAANAISTLANKMGSSLDTKNLTSLIEILLGNLKGRTWNGKEKLLKALASICTNCKDAIKELEGLETQISDTMLQQCQKDNTVYRIEGLKCLGDILSSLELDKFSEVLSIVKTILTVNGDTKDKDEEDLSAEEVAKNRDDNLQLQAASYEVLGKSWIPTTKETQEKYQEFFVTHCVGHLQKITRTLQITVLEAMYNFVQNLKLLQKKSLTEEEEKCLKNMICSILTMMSYALGVPKYTRLRKESLNIIISLLKKLSENERMNEYMLVEKCFQAALPELQEDSNPEIKTRITDIKAIINKMTREK